MSNTALETSYLPSQGALQGIGVSVATPEPLGASEQLQQTKVLLEQALTDHRPDGLQMPSRECVMKNNEALPSEYDL